jgi:hypothetical protein
MPLVRLLDRRPRGTLGLAAAVPRHRQPRDHRRVDSTLLPADTGSHACAAGAHTRASTKAGVGPLFMSDPLRATSAPDDGRWRPGVGKPPARRAEQVRHSAGPGLRRGAKGGFLIDDSSGSSASARRRRPIADVQPLPALLLPCGSAPRRRQVTRNARGSRESGARCRGQPDPAVWLDQIMKAALRARPGVPVPRMNRAAGAAGYTAGRVGRAGERSCSRPISGLPAALPRRAA